MKKVSQLTNAELCEAVLDLQVSLVCHAIPDEDVEYDDALLAEVSRRGIQVPGRD